MLNFEWNLLLVYWCIGVLGRRVNVEFWVYGDFGGKVSGFVQAIPCSLFLGYSVTRLLGCSVW